jgi:hypothetical protein
MAMSIGQPTPFTSNCNMSNIVAFLDLLGFKDKILQHSGEDIDKIYTLLFQLLETAAHSIESLVVSDSVVLKTLASPDNLRHLLELVRLLQAELLLKGVLVRGAITAGEIVFKTQDNGRIRLYGRAYQQAYYLEQTLATFPRVILDPKLLLVMQLENRGEFSKMINGFALSALRVGMGELADVHKTLVYWLPSNSGFDDLPFVAYGHLLLAKVFEFDEHTRKYTNSIGEFIDNLKRLTYENAEHWSKMQWVRSYLSEAFEDYKHFWGRVYPSDGEAIAYTALKDKLMNI